MHTVPEPYRAFLFFRPFLDMVYHALDSPDDDYHALFVLCLLYAMSHNKGTCVPYLPRVCDTVLCSVASFLFTDTKGRRAFWEGGSFLASEADSYSDPL